MLLLTYLIVIKTATKMKTIEQLTGTADIKINLICFLLLSTVIVLTVAFTVLASVNGIKTF